MITAPGKDHQGQTVPKSVPSRTSARRSHSRGLTSPLQLIRAVLTPIARRAQRLWFALHRASRYRRLFDHVPMALYLTAPDGTILDANPAMVQLLGYPNKKSFLKLNAFELFVERDVRRSQMAQIEQEDVVRDYEIQLRRRDGGLIWVLDQVRAVRNASGRVLFYEGSLQDITERKLAQEQLQQTNEKLRALIEASPLAILALDREGTVVGWNRAAEQMFGYSEAEVLGKPLPVVPDEERKRFDTLRERLMRGERLQEIEVRQQRRDGTLIDVAVSAGPLRDATGSAVGMIGVIADVTGRKRAEETQRRLAEILEATPDLVGIATPDGDLVYMNRAGRKMLGIAEDTDLVGVPIGNFLPEADRATLRDEAIPTAIQKGSWTGELHFARTHGREFPVSLVLIANRTPEGEVAFISGVARDLTDHKALEQRLQQARTMEAIGRLAGGIAHDFNNLLTSIIGHSDLLLRHLPDDQHRTDLEEIKAAGQRAAALTHQLLAFSRRQVMQPRPLDLNAIIADLDLRLEEMAGDKIQVVVELDSSLGRVKADPVQLQEIIVSLAENACDAMPVGGRLTIRTAHFDVGLTPEAVRHLDFLEPGPYAVLSIIDNGCGMDEDTLSRIFEPFFSTKKEVKGIGLGLPTVYGIVQQSGGDIWVESAPGKGTTVTVYLPAIEEQHDARTGAEPIDESLGDQRTILLAEDEPAVLTLAARVLQSGGYTVLQARDGVEALEIQQAHPGHIDMLITDVVMPRLGGAELAQRLRKSRPNTRVIYMSGYTDNKTVRDMMANKEVAFLRKPFTPSALLELARRVLSEARRKSA